MTRRVVLLRHAKSDYPTGVADPARPLSERGRLDAPVAGRVLRERVGVPSLVLVSTAVRAQETWSLVTTAFDHPPHHRNEPRMYDASVDDLLLLVRELDSDPSTLVLVGHNPGLEDFAFALSGPNSDPDAVARMSAKFPTCGLAVLEVDRPWTHLVEECAVLTSFDVPRAGSAP